MNDPKATLIRLLRELSVRRGTFTLSHGGTSDLYVDVKQTSLHPAGAFAIASLMHRRLHPEVTAVGGLTMGADPIACSIAVFSFSTPRPIHAFLIRKDAKGHGTKAYLEGVDQLPPTTRVAIVEDTTTTGASLLKAVDRAIEYGFVVSQCLTVVDRQEGASELLLSRGYTLEALTTRAELL